MSVTKIPEIRNTKGEMIVGTDKKEKVRIEEETEAEVQITKAGGIEAEVQVIEERGIEAEVQIIEVRGIEAEVLIVGAGEIEVIVEIGMIVIEDAGLAVRGKFIQIFFSK